MAYAPTFEPEELEDIIQRMRYYASLYGEAQVWRFANELDAMRLQLTAPARMSVEDLRRYTEMLMNEAKTASLAEVGKLEERIQGLEKELAFRAEVLQESQEAKLKAIREELVSRVEGLQAQLADIADFQRWLGHLSTAEIAQAMRESWQVDMEEALRQMRAAAEKLRMEELQELVRAVGGS
jgi:DNA repair exonuclease SbcCD ATPase subunit